eukprot:Nitzschia sp. Nitz4//scaffold15_size197535//54633//55754//NITZ4_001568-RA/size197535-processed-gene-0.292-mRNA-1//-1//CDS//3329537685//6209//frame0
MVLKQNFRPEWQSALAHRADNNNPAYPPPSRGTISTRSASMASRWKQTAQFPWRLHQMLEDAVANDFANIVSWLPDQQTFRVHEVDAFTEDVLHLYFQQTQYKSFQRQLNLWGFERITENGPRHGGYTREHFIRGNASLCSMMKRVKVKGTGRRRQVVRSSPSISPDPKAEDRILPRTVSPASSDRAHEHVPVQISSSSMASMTPAIPAKSPKATLRPIDDLFDDETLTSVLLPLVPPHHVPSCMMVQQENEGPVSDTFANMTFFAVETDQSSMSTDPSSDRIPIISDHSQFVCERAARRTLHEDAEVDISIMTRMTMANTSAQEEEYFSTVPASNMFAV